MGVFRCKREKKGTEVLFQDVVQLFQVVVQLFQDVGQMFQDVG